MAGTLSQVQSNSEERHTSTAARAHSASHDLRMILGTVTHAGMTEESRPGRYRLLSLRADSRRSSSAPVVSAWLAYRFFVAVRVAALGLSLRVGF